jgi:FdhE protein
MNIGEEARPPFAVLPDPSSLFLSRSKRLAALAPGHELAPYLTFLGALTHAQHEIAQDLPHAALPSFESIGQALEHGMPPIACAMFEPDEVVQLTIDRLLTRLAAAQVRTETAAAIQAVRAASPDDRRRMVRAVLEDAMGTDALAQQVLVAAGLQVHFARLAAMLVADDLKPVADGACPVCGSAPMTSSVVGWPKAHNTRFCTCSLCGTMWNVVRVKCVLCSATGGISYHIIEGKPDTVKAETCDSCRAYVKILYQVNDPVLEPLADDVATLGLDMLMAEEGWKRGGKNPFLLGY